jgi:hypothetical protein
VATAAAPSAAISLLLTSSPPDVQVSIGHRGLEVRPFPYIRSALPQSESSWWMCRFTCGGEIIEHVTRDG